MTTTDFAKWLAIGTGVGIEIGSLDLVVTVVRLRPSGARVLGELTISHFREQPAAEWGATYTAFLQKLGVGHLAATILLPLRSPAAAAVRRRLESERGRRADPSALKKSDA